MHKDLETLRYEAVTAQKAVNKEGDPVALRYLQKRAKTANLALLRAVANGSYAVPPRTPWKRLLSPKQYFEAL